MGFAVMADIRVKRKQNTMVQVKEKSKETWGFFLSGDIHIDAVLAGVRSSAAEHSAFIWQTK